jgi:hypothetical protein
MVIHREASSPGALGEQNPLLDVWVKGKLEGHSAREYLAGV